MLELGLCCKFKKEPIKFRTTTATYIGRLSRRKQLEKFSELCLHNAVSLLQSIEYCHKNNIQSFRISSEILPVKTHPEYKYKVKDLPDSKEILKTFSKCKATAEKFNIRLTFHPDQFVVLSSPRKEVVKKSIEDLEYHAEVAEYVGADVINIHGGGGYGDKKSALKRFEKVFKKLSKRVKSRLTLENDDTVYTPSDLLPFCRKLNIPFVYDIHHHICFPDDLTIEQATEQALKTWKKRKPLFHISSPKDSTCKPHADFINAKNFPKFWKKLDITLEVEAKAKEVAIKKLQKELKLFKK